MENFKTSNNTSMGKQVQKYTCRDICSFNSTTNATGNACNNNNWPTRVKCIQDDIKNNENFNLSPPFKVAA